MHSNAFVFIYLNELSIAADNEYTEKQLVSIGIQLIKNTNDFERGLESWIIRPAVEKTWIKFIIFFVETSGVFPPPILRLEK